MNSKFTTGKRRNAGFSVSNLFWTVFVLVVIAAVGYRYKSNLNDYFQRFIGQVRPCGSPIKYSVADVDPRFGITQEQLLGDIDKAGNIWSGAAGKKLFSANPAGALKISLVYDYRQQATDSLKKLGIVVGDDRAAYDVLKAKYDSLKAQYEKENAYYNQLVANYEAAKKAYEKDVKSSNARGGANKQEYAALEQRRIDLNNQVALINQTQITVNALVDSVNAATVILNKLVNELNLQVDQYNTIGNSVGKEFDEGVYTSDASGVSIEIYQFNDEAQLVRVLAHEMGHALGLDHLDNPNAIMYRLNEGANADLTADDIAALKSRCKIQ